MRFVFNQNNVTRTGCLSKKYPYRNHSFVVKRVLTDDILLVYYLARIYLHS